MGNGITPVSEGSIAKVNHQKERADKNSRIVGRSAGGRIKRSQKIGNEIDAKPLKLMNSRFEGRLRKSDFLRSIKRRKIEDEMIPEVKIRSELREKVKKSTEITKKWG